MGIDVAGYNWIYYGFYKYTKWKNKTSALRQEIVRLFA
jgi:hypothetical protein